MPQAPTYNCESLDELLTEGIEQGERIDKPYKKINTWHY